MKTSPLSVLFAALLLTPALYAAEPSPPATPPDSPPTATPQAPPPREASLELPQTITRTGHEFNARCSDEDFAETRFPQKLVNTCTQLLLTWQAEASNRGNDTAGGAVPVPNTGAMRIIHGIPFSGW